VPVRRGEEEGKLKMAEAGVATDADAFWFCLKPEAKKSDPRFAFVQRREFRQAISHAVDREEFARTVFLGEAVPVWGPVTSGNKPWFTPNLPRYPYDAGEGARTAQGDRPRGSQRQRSRRRREGDRGALHRDHTTRPLGVRERHRRGARLLAKVGIALDIAPLEATTMIERMLKCDYDAIYMRVLMTDLDPAMNLDFWLSSGDTHYWNIASKMPATDWETRINVLMQEQAATLDENQRRMLFNEVQRILAENLPVLHFAAPRLFFGHSRRLVGVIPSVTRPPILWNADSLSVTNP
jgi:peptide/nickel transport system substrate-binding protein